MLPYWIGRKQWDFSTKKFFAFTTSETDLGYYLTHSLFKSRFWATAWRQRPKFDIFHKVLFFTLGSSANLVLNAVPIAAGQCFWRGLTFDFFFKKKIDYFWVFHAFSKKKKLKVKFSQTALDKTVSFFTNYTELDYYHKKVNERVISRVVKWTKT